MTATLFPSVLGAQFVALDPCLRWVHSGDSRRLRGSVTVELKWFRIAATIKARDGCYHFVVDSELIGVGRIVRYEGLLDAAA
jgi:hypothetical protein